MPLEAYLHLIYIVSNTYWPLAEPVSVVIPLICSPIDDLLGGDISLQAYIGRHMAIRAAVMTAPAAAPWRTAVV